jgi:phage terminase large subunit
MTARIVDPNLGPKRYRPGEGFEANSWAQERFLISKAPELLYSGHRGSSKSRTICEKADLLCRSVPGAKIVLSRKKREHMGKTTLATLLNETISPSHRDWGWAPSADGGSTLYYPNGSEILCAGLDNPGRMLSGEFMANFTDQGEELEEDEFLAIGGSLRQRVDKHGNEIPFHQNGIACNPDGPGHFLFKRFRPDLAGHSANFVTRSDEPTPILSGETLPAGRILREVIVAGLSDNMENLPVEYQAWLASLTGRYRERFVLGLWVAFDGYVYDCFDPRIHVLPRPQEWNAWGGYPPPSWKRYRGIDFGFTNPFVFQWWARSPEGVWWLYREIYHSHRFIKQHRETIRAYESEELAALNAGIERHNERSNAWPKRDPLKRLSWANTVADTENAENRALLDELGIPSNPAIKEVEPGIQTVYELLAPKLDPETNVTRARLYLCEDARREIDPVLIEAGKPTCTAEEFPLYQRARRKATDRDSSAAEAPRKGEDHGLDAARYVVHSARVSGDQKVIRLFDRSVRESIDW